MQVTADRIAIAAELRLLTVVSERRASAPILAHVLVAARDGRLRLAATDLDVSLTVDLEADVVAEGAVSVPSSKLHALVKSLRSETVTFSAEGEDQLVLAGDGARITLHGKPEEEWPETPTVPRKVTATFDFADLLPAIKRVLFAVSDEISRFQLNGARLETGRARTCLVSTDGHRLSVAHMPKAGRKSAALIDRKALTVLSRMKVAETIDYAVGEHHVAFRAEGRELIARIVEGQFPQYRELLTRAEGAGNLLAVDRLALLQALNTLKPMVGNRTRAVVINGGGNGHVTIKATDLDLGEAVAEVPVEWKGKPLTIGVDRNYLEDWPKALTADRLEFHFGNEHQPIYARAVGDDSVEYLVMPMKL